MAEPKALTPTREAERGFDDDEVDESHLHFVENPFSVSHQRPAYSEWVTDWLDMLLIDYQTSGGIEASQSRAGGH